MADADQGLIGDIGDGVSDAFNTVKDGLFGDSEQAISLNAF